MATTAFTVADSVNWNGPSYNVEEGVGVLPSMV